jgi:gliding motility-associated-like protein
VEFNPISFIDQIPNVITPNNDFVNDLLSFQSSNLAEYQLVILNRWGNTIFETDNPTNFWDGKNGDRFVDDGVYFYKITYRLICDEEVSVLHGNISVVK